MWVSYGATIEVREGETEEQAKSRLNEIVASGLDERVEELRK